MKANRSVSTCWKAPSTLRLRRSAPASTQRGGEVHHDPGERDHQHGAALTSGGSISRRTPSSAITHGERHERGAVHLGGQDLGAPEAEREAAAGRPPREPGGEQRERDRAGVGEHVRRVGEQGERVGEHARHDLHGHKPEDQRERDGQAPGVVRVDVAVVVMPPSGLRVACSFERRPAGNARPWMRRAGGEAASEAGVAVRQACELVARWQTRPPRVPRGRRARAAATAASGHRGCGTGASERPRVAAVWVVGS